MKKNIILLTFIALLAATTAASTVNMNISESEVDHGKTQVIGTAEINASENSSFEISDISTNTLPFNTQYTRTEKINDTNLTGSKYEKYNITSTVPQGFQAGNYTGTTIFSFGNQSSIEKNIQLKIREDKNWTLNQSSHLDNISVGNNGDFGNFTVQNTGNTKVEVKTNITGNITDYLSVDSRSNVFPGLDKTVPIQYQVSSDTSFGTYTGKLNVTAADRTETIEIETELLDNIKPRFETSSIEGFQSSIPREFSVRATDNLKVENVTAKVFYETTEQQENNTVEVTNIHEEFRFKTTDNSDKWTGTMSNADRPGDYKINITATDESSNSVRQTSEFTIEELDAVRPTQNVVLPAYIYDSNVEEGIGSIEKDTPVTVRLTSFNQELGADWQVGMDTPSGKEYFNEVNGTIELTKSQEMNLFVYSREAGKYNGEITYEPIESHVNLPKTTFSGQFTNHTTPKDQEFSLYDTIYNCAGYPSQQLNKSYWSCNFNISAGKVEPGNDLQEEVQFAIPSQVRQDKISLWQQQVDNAENRASSANSQRNYSLAFAGFLLFLSIYFITGYPRHYSVYRKSSWDADMPEGNAGERVKNLLPNRLTKGN